MTYSGTKDDPSRHIMKPAYALTRDIIMGWMSGQPTMAHMGKVYGCEVPYVPLFEVSKKSLMFQKGDK